MASTNRSTTHHLVDELINHSKHYSFFQAVKLISDYQEVLQSETGRVELKETLLRFSVNPQLNHYDNDIDSIEWRETEEQCNAQINVNFMGLYGATSPLPIFYTETILQTDKEDEHTQAFMDLFNHRLISLVYFCWEKYRYYLQYKKGHTDAFSNWMFALSGLYQSADVHGLRDYEGNKGDGAIDWSRLLPFTSMLAMRCHSSSIIESILRYYFKWQAIHIKSNILRWVTIEEDQQNRLGMRCATLGDDLILGEQIEDRCGKFRIIISQLPYSLFCQFLPDGAFNRTLKKLVNFILRDPLDYDIELQLLKPEIPQLCLTNTSSEKLGLTTWIGINNNTDKSVLLPGR